MGRVILEDVKRGIPRDSQFQARVQERLGCVRHTREARADTGQRGRQRDCQRETDAYRVDDTRADLYEVLSLSGPQRERSLHQG